MASQARIPEAEIQSALRRLPEWKLTEGKLHRQYQFPDFSLAFGFMAAAATVAQAMNHHPDWSNSYNRVTVDLVSHDAGGVTSRDLQLAEKLEEIARRLQ